MTDSSFKKQNTDVPRGARTSLLALTAGLAFTLLAVAPAVNAGEHGQAMKQGSQQEHAKQPAAQNRRGSGKRAERRHREPVEAVECGDVLSKAGNYSLNSDLVCTSPIKVTGSNVHLDLAGHSISCDAENWMYVDPASVTVRYPQIVTALFVNADSAIEWEESGSGIDGIPQAPVLNGFKVKNGTIADCTFGMYFFKTDRSKVRNMHLDGNNVARPQFNGASAGVTTFFSNDNDFIDNHVSGGSLNGFELAISNGNRLRGNLLEGATDDGIILIGSKGNVIRKNTVVDNPFGIYVTLDFETFELSTGNVIASNHVSGNTDEGITLFGPTNDNIVRGNTVTNNGGVGILLLGLAPFGLPVPADNTLRGNIANGNPTADLMEADLGDDFETPVIPAECSNLWKHNTFGTSLGPVDCIE